jgi:hypothetical protein
MQAASGTYNYTGASVDFSKTNAIDALTGGYSYNGANVNLVFTGLAPDIPTASGVVVSGTFGSGVTGTGSL